MTDQATTEVTENTTEGVQESTEAQSVEVVEESSGALLGDAKNDSEATESVEQTQQSDESTDTDESTASTDQGDADGTEGEGETDGEGEGESKAPESYEFVAPEGLEYDQAVLDAFSPVAKQLDLSQDEAQNVLDKVSPVIQERMQTKIAELRTGWESASRTDPEIGGNGNEKVLTKNLAIAEKSIQSFGDNEYRELLETTGIGNHPAVIRYHLKVGNRISEDGFVNGDSPGEDNQPGTPRSEQQIAKNLYKTK